MASSRTSRHGWRARRARLAALLLTAAPCALAATEAQHEPELQAVVRRAIDAAPCFADKFDSAVWFRLQEPRLRKFVEDVDERMLILETAYCEASRAGEQRLPLGLIMAIMDVESRFDRWAVSSAGAVGLMQVMPFWPEQLGMQRRDLSRIKSNMQMGCAILRHYLKREKNDWHKALARYNGSVGSRKYSDLVLTRWTTRWHGADDLGVPGVAAKR
jgi:soluble lytic murein transglycosylase-like protein